MAVYTPFRGFWEQESPPGLAYPSLGWARGPRLKRGAAALRQAQGPPAMTSKESRSTKQPIISLSLHQIPPTMKLAEALSIRKDLQKRIQQLGQRIQNNVKVQEGELSTLSFECTA